MSLRRPFDDILALVGDLPAPDAAAREGVAARLGGFGPLGGTAAWLASWRADARVRKPIVALYVGASVAEPGDPAAAAQARLEHLAAGGGAVSALARAQGAGVEVFDLALARPSPDAALRPAMSERECAATLAFGMEALAKAPDLLLLGDASPGSGRGAAALALALFGGAPEDWLEDGAGAGEAAWVGAAAERAAAAAAGAPLALLAQIGGREVAALAGAITAARVQRTPVVVDGHAAAAACAVLDALNPDALAHVRAASPSRRAGCARLLDRLGLAAPFSAGVSEGEGAGAAAVLPLFRLAGDLAAQA